jgi:3-hydroxyisobutyrate dehydrogenase-like beta-hydroxyacid dehydrogenase
VGLILTDQRRQGRQGLSLAALAGLVEEAMQAASRAGVDPDSVEPTVRAAMSGKIKNLEIKVL